MFVWTNVSELYKLVIVLYICILNFVIIFYLFKGLVKTFIEMNYGWNFICQAGIGLYKTVHQKWKIY